VFFFTRPVVHAQNPVRIHKSFNKNEQSRHIIEEGKQLHAKYGNALMLFSF